MLIRSASTPMFSSLVTRNSVELSPEFDHVHQIPHTHSVKMSRARSENDVPDLGVSKWKQCTTSLKCLNGVVEGGEEKEQDFGWSSRALSLDRLFTSSGLDEVVEEEEEENVFVGGGGVGSDGGGGSYGGGGFSDSKNEDDDDGTSAYYQKMIQENPGNGLLLGNYAKFLKEVRGDLVKAEEYCERAILANPNDGDVVSMYAELMWELRRDGSRAERYFDQAVQAAPDDCYVMASYARLLWDAEDELEDEEKQEESEGSKTSTTRWPPDFFQGTSSLPLTAVS